MSSLVVLPGRRHALAVIAVCLIGAPPVASAAGQMVHRIGMLCDESVGYFLEQLRALGYRKHHNVQYLLEDVDASAAPDRYAAQLAAADVHVIIACSNDLAAAAKRATSTVPIVLLYGVAPVETGLVESLARPGGNLTGSVAILAEMAGKSVELFRSAIPGLRRVVALVKAGDAAAQVLHKETERAATELRLSLTTIEVRDASDLIKVFERLARERIDGVLVSPSLGLRVYDVVVLAAAHRIPAMYPFAPAVRAGGLMAYSPNWTPQSQRNAQIVDRILRGAHPRNIPMQQPLEYAFGINLKTARALGLTIPPAAMLRATWTVE